MSKKGGVLSPKADKPTAKGSETKGSKGNKDPKDKQELKEPSEKDASSEDQTPVHVPAPVDKDKDKKKSSLPDPAKTAVEDDESETEVDLGVGEFKDNDEKGGLKVKDTVESYSESVVDSDLLSQNRSSSRSNDHDDQPQIWFDEEDLKVLQSYITDGKVSREVVEGISNFPHSQDLQDKGTFTNTLPPADVKALLDRIGSIPIKDIEELTALYAHVGPSNPNFWIDISKLYQKYTGYPITAPLGTLASFISSTGSTQFPLGTRSKKVQKLKFFGAASPSVDPKAAEVKSLKNPFDRQSEPINPVVLEAEAAFLGPLVEKIIEGAVEIPRGHLELTLVYSKLSEVLKFTLHKVAIILSNEGNLAGATKVEMEIRVIVESSDPFVDQNAHFDALSLWMHTKGIHATDPRLIKSLLVTIGAGAFGSQCRILLHNCLGIGFETYEDPSSSFTRQLKKFQAIMDSQPVAQRFIVQEKEGALFLQLMLGSVDKLKHDESVIEVLRFQVIAKVQADPDQFDVPKIGSMLGVLTQSGMIGRSSRYSAPKPGYSEVAKNERNAFWTAANLGEGYKAKGKEDMDWEAQAYASYSVGSGHSSAQSSRGKGRGKGANSSGKGQTVASSKPYDLNDLPHEELAARLALQWNELRSALDMYPDKNFLKQFAKDYTEVVSFKGRQLRRFRLDAEGRHTRIEAQTFNTVVEILKKSGAGPKLLLRFKDTTSTDWARGLPIDNKDTNGKGKGQSAAQSSGDSRVKGPKGEKVEKGKFVKGEKGSQFGKGLKFGDKSAAYYLAHPDEHYAVMMAQSDQSEADHRAMVESYYAENQREDDEREPDPQGEIIDGKWHTYVADGRAGDEDDLDTGAAEGWGRAFPVKVYDGTAAQVNAAILAEQVAERREFEEFKQKKALSSLLGGGRHTSNSSSSN